MEEIEAARPYGRWIAALAFHPGTFAVTAGGLLIGACVSIGATGCESSDRPAFALLFVSTAAATGAGFLTTFVPARRLRGRDVGEAGPLRSFLTALLVAAVVGAIWFGVGVVVLSMVAL